jgi:hypothetical protein
MSSAYSIAYGELVKLLIHILGHRSVSIKHPEVLVSVVSFSITPYCAQNILYWYGVIYHSKRMENKRKKKQ